MTLLPLSPARFDQVGRVRSVVRPGLQRVPPRRRVLPLRGLRERHGVHGPVHGRPGLRRRGRTVSKSVLLTLYSVKKCLIDTI